ncbi:hypothetical protein EDF19_1756 [Curtobacterium sp. PhB115]|nr:hypothetical protein EDF19_1756 [Curtobacterium sp. PhB115]
MITNTARPGRVESRAQLDRTLHGVKDEQNDGPLWV